jgi:Domain of unknown function (DUF2019)
VKKFSLQDKSVTELVERFAALSITQYQAEIQSDIAKQNKFIEQGWAVADELKARPGDQRSALSRLYDHPNVQARLNAARLTLATAPTTAREVIQAIADSKKYPQAMDAGMCLSALDKGIFTPT